MHWAHDYHLFTTLLSTGKEGSRTAPAHTKPLHDTSSLHFLTLDRKGGQRHGMHWAPN